MFKINCAGMTGERPNASEEYASVEEATHAAAHLMKSGAAWIAWVENDKNEVVADLPAVRKALGSKRQEAKRFLSPKTSPEPQNGP